MSQQKLLQWQLRFDCAISRMWSSHTTLEAVVGFGRKSDDWPAAAAVLSPESMWPNLSHLEYPRQWHWCAFLYSPRSCCHNVRCLGGRRRAADGQGRGDFNGSDIHSQGLGIADRRLSCFQCTRGECSAKTYLCLETQDGEVPGGPSLPTLRQHMP